MTTQPRTPAGSPDGGQFATTAGSESTSGLRHSPPISRLVVLLDGPSATITTDTGAGCAFTAVETLHLRRALADAITEVESGKHWDEWEAVGISGAVKVVIERNNNTPGSTLYVNRADNLVDLTENRHDQIALDFTDPHDGETAARDLITSLPADHQPDQTWCACCGNPMTPDADGDWITCPNARDWCINCCGTCCDPKS